MSVRTNIVPWLAHALLWSCLLFAAAGCGFQLRSYGFGGAADSYAVVGKTRLSVVPVLRRTLEQSGVAEVSAAEAALVLELLDQRRDRRSVSTAGGARAAEYETSLGVQYRILDNSGAELAPPTWIERERVYRIDRDNIVGSSGEQAILERELVEDVAGQIVRAMDAVGRRLQAQAAADAG